MNIILSLFLSGVFFGSGPCMASCGPLLISYVAGRNKNIRESLIDYILFSFSRVSVYIGLGFLTYAVRKFILEQFLGAVFKYVLITGGIFVVLLGAMIAIGNTKSGPFCYLEGFLKNKDQKNVIVMGLIMGLLPCAPLVGILVSVGLMSKSALQSILYALSFGIGTFISPLIILVACAGVISQWVARQHARILRIFNAACGIIMIILGASLIKRGF